MTRRHLRKLCCLALLLTGILHRQAVADEPDLEKKPEIPKVDEKAPDFSLESLRGGKVTLSRLTADGPVVLLVLRGYPGYQCPICNRQVGDYLSRAREFERRKARVVMIYPGPADHLKERADEFIGDRTFPKSFHLLLDPDYEFTLKYALRWNAPRETAYPSTFVIDAEGVVRLANVSRTHGGRLPAADALKALDQPAAGK